MIRPGCKATGLPATFARFRNRALRLPAMAENLAGRCNRSDGGADY